MRNAEPGGDRFRQVGARVVEDELLALEDEEAARQLPQHEAEVGQADGGFQVPLQGGGCGGAGDFRVPGQQPVHPSGETELPLQVADVEKDVIRGRLVGMQPEAAGSAVRHDRGDDRPQGLRHVP